MFPNSIIKNYWKKSIKCIIAIYISTIFINDEEEDEEEDEEKEEENKNERKKKIFSY